MASRLRFLQISLCLLGASNLLTATELPTTVQLDLVFPKDNTTYKPVYPFPVVLALHNSSAASRLPISWSWEMVTYSTPENGVPIEILAYGRTGIDGGPPPEDTLIIAPVSELINTTVKDFILRYSFGTRSTCNESGYVPPERDFDVFFDGRIRFSIDRENGQVPDVTAAGSCATPIGSIGIEKEVIKMFGIQNETCAVLKPGPQPTKSCAFHVDATVAKQVEERMLNETRCEGQSWPNVTGLVGKCKPKTSGYGRPWTSTAILSSVAGIAVVVVLFLV